MTEPAELLSTLQQATTGLQWLSESDYPFEVVHWQDLPTLTPDRLRQLIHQPADATVEIQDLDSFFEVATQNQDWHSADDRAVVQRYQALVKTLKQLLTNPQVYRIGEVEIEILILGKTGQDCYSGVSTRAIET